MIVKPFEDELFYSVLARTQECLGYSNSVFLNSMFLNGKQKPIVFFWNKLQPDIRQELKRIKSLEEWVMENTMFSIFSAFIPFADRHNSFEALVSQNTEKYRNSLYIPKVESKTLKYCPVCCKEKGLYWNRKHQIPNVKICTEHRVWLEEAQDTTIEQAKMIVGFYIPSEHINTDAVTRVCNTECVISLAEAMVAMFDYSPSDYFSISVYLQDNLQNYKKGFVLEISRLYEDMQKFYEDDIPSKSLIHSVILGKQYNFEAICHILAFLNIRPRSGEMSEVRDIHRTTKNRVYAQIAKDLNMPEQTVTTICKEYEKYFNRSEHFGGATKFDYDALDRQYLPRCRELCEEMYRQGKRVTYRALQIGLGNLPDGQIKKLPKCRAVIADYLETNEEYQRRRLVNYINDSAGKELTITMVLEGTHMKRQLIQRCYESGQLSTDISNLLAEIFGFDTK